MPTEQQIQEWKEKAQKWDELEDEILSKFVDDEGNEIEAQEGVNDSQAIADIVMRALNIN